MSITVREAEMAGLSGVDSGVCVFHTHLFTNVAGIASCGARRISSSRPPRIPVSAMVKQYA